MEIAIDHKLTLAKHINNLCNKASKRFENFDKKKEIFISRVNNVFLRLL